MKISLILFVSLFIFSCGIKGPPLPPIEETTIQKQKTTEAVNSTQAPLNSSDSTKAKKNTK